MSKKENLHWVYLFKRSASFLSLCEHCLFNGLFYKEKTMRKQGAKNDKKKILIGFISLSAAPHFFLFVNIVFLTAYFTKRKQ